MTTRSWIRAELKKNFDKANRGAREAARAEPRAVEARYMPASRHLRVRLTNGASLSLPVSIIPELRNATPVQLTGIEILPGGDGLHWEALDFTISASCTAARKARCNPLSLMGRLLSPVGEGNSQTGLRWVSQCWRNIFRQTSGSGT